MRLFTPAGDVAGDTARGDLGLAKVNYTRRGRHGSAWLRPGFHLRHAGGSHLVGTLYPELAWEGVSHDPEIPEFELRPPDFEALCGAAQLASTEPSPRSSFLHDR
jgi:hypothetical protein